jgi:diguanylate cyclase (GGDEF)-like protein
MDGRRTAEGRVARSISYGQIERGVQESGPHVTNKPGNEPANLLDLSEDARSRGDYQAGAALAREAAGKAAELGDERLRGLATRLLAKHLIRLGEHESAVHCAVQAVEALTEAGEEAAACDALAVQGLAHMKLGLHEEALAALTAGLDMAEKLDDDELLFWMYNRIGGVHSNLSDFSQGRIFLCRARDLAVAGLGDECRFGILNNLADNAVGLARQLRERGENAAADQALSDGLGYAQTSLALARAAAHPNREATSLVTYGTLLGLAGDHDTALTLLCRAREIAAAHRYHALELAAEEEAATVHLAQGRIDQAVTLLGEVLNTAADPNRRATVMMVHAQLSAAYEKLGDFEAALRHYQAYHAAERAARTALAATRARLLTHRFELTDARMETENARLEAALHRVRLEELENEKWALQTEARQAARHAREDQLTGLWNRRYQDEELPKLVSAAEATARPLCVALCDVDEFKSINDRLGHLVGDQVLGVVAGILRSGCRPADLVARMGGDEFFLAFAGIDLESAYEICERMRHTVETHDWHLVQRGLTVTLSFGVACLTPGDTIPELLRAADGSLYAAKQRGRNRVHDGFARTPRR